jgi:hypothetical protein
MVEEKDILMSKLRELEKENWEEKHWTEGFKEAVKEFEKVSGVKLAPENRLDCEWFFISGKEFELKRTKERLKEVVE